MAYAIFNQDHYELYSNNENFWFNDSEHLYLFDYLHYNLSQIELLLEGFFTEQFDFEQMRLKKDRPPMMFNDDYEKDMELPNVIMSQDDYTIENAYLSGIIDILLKSHPFYGINSNAMKGAKSIVLDYFNMRACLSEIVLTKNEYVRRLEKLLDIRPFILVDDKTKQFIGDNLFMLIRYAEYFNQYDTYTGMRRKIRKGEKIDLPLLGIMKEQRQINQMLTKYMNIPESKARKAKRANKEVKQDRNFFNRIPVNDLSQLLLYEAIEVMASGLNVRQCNCCDAFFITKDNRRNYCDRIYKGDKTCTDVGPDRYFIKNKDDMYKVYRAAMSKNIMRNDRKQITEEEYKWWKAKSPEKMKRKCKDFDEWIGLTSKEIKRLYKKEGTAVFQTFSDV